jgi:AraC-like DNA-binding protein
MAWVHIDTVEQWRELARKSKYCAADMALELGISRRQLQRCIQVALGGNPHRWLMQERLAAAGESLKKLRSVKRVAFEYRFKQVSHFSREFKLCYGLSPAAFLLRSRQGLPTPPLRANGKHHPEVSASLARP